MKISIEIVVSTASNMMGLKKDGSTEIFDRRMKSMFGLIATTVTEVWNGLIRSGFLPERTKIDHLLWTLSFFKSYDTLDVYCCRYKVAKTTFWKWVKNITYAVYQLKVVSFRFFFNNHYIKKIS